MNLEKYSKNYIYFSLLIVATILFFGFANTFSKPHVRSIAIRESKDNRAPIDQQIEIEFSQPMLSVIGDRSIELKSDSDRMQVTTNWSGNRLFIKPNQKLSYNTNYSLALTDLFDRYNEPIEPFVYNFQTKTAELVYLQKNAEAEDKIISLKLDETANTQELYKSQTIKQYTINKNFIVICEDSGENNQVVKIIDRNTGKQTDLQIESGQVGEMKLSQKQAVLIYTVQKLKLDSGFYIPQGGFELNVYNISTGQNTEIEVEEFTNDVQNIFLAPDEHSILFQNVTNEFYLINLNDINQITPVGRYTRSGGFNGNADRIIFLTYDFADPVNSYTFITSFQTDRTSIDLTDGSTDVTDPIFYQNSNSVAFAQAVELREDIGRSRYKILMLDENGTMTDLLEDESLSLELPQISMDDRYLAIEAYTMDDLQYNYARNYNYQTKPDQAKMKVLDLDSKQVIFEDNGIEAIWVK